MSSRKPLESLAMWIYHNSIYLQIPFSLHVHKISKMHIKSKHTSKCVLNRSKYTTTFRKHKFILSLFWSVSIINFYAPNFQINMFCLTVFSNEEDITNHFAFQYLKCYEVQTPTAWISLSIEGLWNIKYLSWSSSCRFYYNFSGSRRSKSLK